MTIFYTPSEVGRLLKRTANTIKVWSQDPAFRIFLSPQATPPKGDRRVFTPADLEVLALVADRLAHGLARSDIVAQLAAGQREEIPAGVADLSTTAPPELLARLQDTIGDLRLQLRAAQDDATGARAQVDLLQRQLSDARAELRAALLDLGALQGRKP